MLSVLSSTTMQPLYFFFFFFNDTATTEIYTLSLHDALPICNAVEDALGLRRALRVALGEQLGGDRADRKSTRLNSSHTVISYAVFCLKKKKGKSGRETSLCQVGGRAR